MNLLLGNTIRIEFNTYNAAGTALADPVSLSVTLKLPSGTNAVYAYPASSKITKASTGSYVFSHEPTVTGDHRYRIETEGPATAVEGVFAVQPSSVL